MVDQNTSEEWVCVASLDDIPKGKQRCINAGGLSLIICRVYTEVYAVKNLCPHLGKPLEGGRLQEYELSCPYHNAVFDIRDGRPVTGPSVWPATTYPCQIKNRLVYVNISQTSDDQQAIKDPRIPRN